METRLVKPSYSFAFRSHQDFQPFADFINEAVKKILPQEILSDLQNPKMLKQGIAKLDQLLPFLVWSESQNAEGPFSISLLCPANYTHGVGRYLTDTISKWLIPGKNLPVIATQGLNFEFVQKPGHRYYYHQIIVNFDGDTDLVRMKMLMPELAKKIRINIISVEHSRSTIANSNLSIEQKTAIIQEKISSLLDRSPAETDLTVFDQMHIFLYKMLAEEKISQFEEKFNQFLDHKSKLYDEEIFTEIQQFVQLLPEKFTAIRDLHHISRLVFFQHVFRKSLQREMAQAPNRRFINLKLLKTVLQQPDGSHPVLGVLIGINLDAKNELFEEKHIFQALQRCFFKARKVKDSYLVDRRPHEQITLFYLEIEKEDCSPFHLEEMKFLRKNLSRELKEGIENVSHPVFMPRNEEEVLRNIVLLSQQLKYVTDIPQMIISFEAQTQNTVSFTVILLRLLTDKTLPLKEMIANTDSQLKFFDIDVQEAGTLRKKYPKEASVFRVVLEKTTFLRKDYSLDLFKARQTVASELCRLIGDIRDFNGGILSKQHEVFLKLRESLQEHNPINDFLLENFFYSLSPPIMQSLLPPALLKKLFLMLLGIFDFDFKTEKLFYVTESEGAYLLLALASPLERFKEEVSKLMSACNIPSMEHAFTCLDIDEMPCFGYIIRAKNEEEFVLMESMLRQAILRWMEQYCPHES